MKKISILVLLIIMMSAPAFCDGDNIAPRCRVLVSGTPNPAWEGKNLVDDDIGPSKGWIGRVDPKNPPWVRFIIPYPATVTKLRVMPASFTEVERRRFSRPKKVGVLIKGDKNEALEFTLEDKEDAFQDLPIGMDGVYEISIVINEVYTGVRIPDMAGFQEIQIDVPQRTLETAAGASGTAAYTDSEPSPAEETRALLDKIADVESDKKAAEEKTEEKEGPRAQGSLSPEEREILGLLRDLLQRLEQKFIED